MAISAAIMAASTAASFAMTPSAPSMDNTDYDLLRKTQEQADMEAADSKARMEEERKREELRQQLMGSRDVYTSDAGASDLGFEIRNKVLGGGSEDPFEV